MPRAHSDSHINNYHVWKSSTLLSDRGGVSVTEVAKENAPEHALRPVPYLLLCSQLTREQSWTLKNKSIICYLNIYWVVQFIHLPLEMKSLC